MSDLIPENELAEVRKMAAAMALHPDEQVRAGASATLRFVKHIDALTTALVRRPPETPSREAHENQKLADIVRAAANMGVASRVSVGESSVLIIHEGVAESDAARRLAIETATLHQHISELEKSLENVRKERDEMAALAERRGTALETYAKAWEGAERDARAKDAALASLKPSGQVAEDVALLEGLLVALPPQSRCEAALSRLAAQAQGYEAAVKERDTIQEESRARMVNLTRAWAAEEQAKGERDAAVADNAAKDKAFREYVEMHGVEHDTIPGSELPCPEDDTCECPLVRALGDAFNDSKPHPGAALLEELATLRGVQVQAQVDAKFVHDALGWAGEWPSSLPAPSRAVVALLERMTRLEEAVDTPVQNALEAIQWCAQWGRWTLADLMARVEDAIRGRPFCLDGSCAKCRSGEPCH